VTKRAAEAVEQKFIGKGHVPVETVVIEAKNRLLNPKYLK